MTRRLVQIDLTQNEYFVIRACLVERKENLEETVGRRAQAARLIRKLDDIWDVRGREGRGINTKQIKRGRA